MISLKRHNSIKLASMISILTLTFSTMSVSATELPQDTYIQDTLAVESIDAVGEARESSLPATYDSRTLSALPVPGVQADTGICWSYAAVTQANTSLIRRNIYSSDSARLSAQHFAYYFYQLFNDPLKNATGDGNVSLETGKDYLNKAGNHMFSTFTLANWTGAAEETSDVTALGATDDIAHLQNAYWMNLSSNETDMEQIKQAIIDYSAVAIAYYSADGNLNADTLGYYNDSSLQTNHSVNIVGWDDNYAASNFLTAPEGDGAWLVQNSYYDGIKEGGDYFWLSYYDKSINTTSSKAFVFDFESADNYDYNYQYDGSGAVSTAYMSSNASDYQINDGGSIANIFTVDEEAETTYESLKAVSFATYSTNISYSIQVYKNPPEITVPTSGEPMLDTPVTGSTTYTGYYTVPISCDTDLERGDNFAVVITLHSGDGRPITYFADESCKNGSWIQFVNVTEQEQSYRSVDGVSWQDMNTIDHFGDGNGMTIRIKAFTDAIEDKIVVPDEPSSVPDNLETEEQGATKTLKSVPDTGDDWLKWLYNFVSFIDKDLSERIQ